MFEKELVRIGKLAKGHHIDDRHTKRIAAPEQDNRKRVLVFKTLPSFDNNLLALDEVFLLIDKRKVRYLAPVSLTLSNNKTKLVCRFDDRLIAESIDKAKSIYLAVAADTYQDEQLPQEQLIGMDIYYNGKLLATVVDTFRTKAHQVIVARTNEGKELLLPDIDEYVRERDLENRRITFKNIRDFLDM